MPSHNPYHRVDMVKSSRHVELFVDGVKVADTKRPYLLKLKGQLSFWAEKDKRIEIIVDGQSIA